jgi:hypothetical protein
MACRWARLQAEASTRDPATESAHQGNYSVGIQIQLDHGSLRHAWVLVLADHRVEVIAFVIKFVMTTASTLIVNIKYVGPAGQHACQPPCTVWSSAVLHLP